MSDSHHLGLLARCPISRGTGRGPLSHIRIHGHAGRRGQFLLSEIGGTSDFTQLS
jgi:hypothetical protein